MRNYLTAAGITLAILIGGYLGGRPAGATATTDNSAVSVGAGIRYICQTSAPAPVGRARNWVRCSDGAMMYTSAANVDSVLNTSADLIWDSSAYAANVVTSDNAGNYTTGVEVAFTTAATATGVKIYWAGSTSTTLKASLWQVSGSARKATGTLAISSAGIKTISFTTPFSMSAYTPYMFSVWDTSASEYQSSSDVSMFPSSTDPFLGGLHMVYMTRGAYAVGDAIPSTMPGATQFYPVAPVYTIP